MHRPQNGRELDMLRILMAVLGISVMAILYFLPAHVLAEQPDNKANKSSIDYVNPAFRDRLAAFLKRHERARVRFSDQTIPAIRANYSRWAPAVDFLATPSVAEVLIPHAQENLQVRAYVIGADANIARKRGAILHIHGGGYIMGDAASGVPRLQGLAEKYGGVIVTVDYRLAPETRFPGPLEDIYVVLKWLYANADKLGIDPLRISVMGESAGGGLAAMLSTTARDRGEVSIYSQLLVSPMLDDRTASSRAMPSWMGYGSWSQEANRYGWGAFMGVPAGSDVVPAGAVPARVEDFSGLPVTFIGVGSIDLFAEENIEYARRLVRAGVPTEMVVISGGFHGFQNMMADTPPAQQFDAALNAAIKRALSAPVVKN